MHVPWDSRVGRVAGGAGGRRSGKKVWRRRRPGACLASDTQRGWRWRRLRRVGVDGYWEEGEITPTRRWWIGGCGGRVSSFGVDSLPLEKRRMEANEGSLRISGLSAHLQRPRPTNAPWTGRPGTCSLQPAPGGISPASAGPSPLGAGPAPKCTKCTVPTPCTPLSPAPRPHGRASAPAWSVC